MLNSIEQKLAMKGFKILLNIYRKAPEVPTPTVPTKLKVKFKPPPPAPKPKKKLPPTRPAADDFVDAPERFVNIDWT